MLKTTVTSQHPNYPSVYTVNYKNKGYSINIDTGKVWTHEKDKHTGIFYNRDIKTKSIIAAVNLAVTEYINQ